MLDLETTGVDVSRSRIVEIAAAQAVGRLGLPGACFAQVVKVPDEILQTPASVAASAVHGIDSPEIAESHTFPTVWARFLEFVERCLNDYVQDAGESDSDEEPAPPRMPEKPPVLLVAAHNGYRAEGAR
jgi:DNA polymerase III epsilon subunit-like protein